MPEIPLVNLNSGALQELVRIKRQLAVSSERIESGLRVASPFDGLDAFFDSTNLSYDAIRLMAIKEKITEAATITGNASASLVSIVNTVNEMKTQALAARASSVSTTVTGNVVTTASADVGVTDGNYFNITYKGTTTSVTYNTGETYTSLATEISNITGLTATVSDGNALIITAADGNDITIADGTGNLATTLGLASSTNGIVASATAIEAAEAQYDVLLTKINTIVGEATFHGVNLLSISPDSLTVSFNEDGSTSITIAGVASDATSLGLSAINTTNGFSTDAGITTVIAALDAALTTLTETRASITASDVIFDSRLNFTSGLIDLMNEGVSKLSGANLTEERALALALQVRHDMTFEGVGRILQSGSTLSSMLNALSVR